jgi:hypothetical protein
MLSPSAVWTQKIVAIPHGCLIHSSLAVFTILSSRGAAPPLEKLESTESSTDRYASRGQTTPWLSPRAVDGCCRGRAPGAGVRPRNTAAAPRTVVVAKPANETRLIFVLQTSDIECRQHQISHTTRSTVSIWKLASLPTRALCCVVTSLARHPACAATNALSTPSALRNECCEAYLRFVRFGRMEMSHHGI